MKYYAGHETVYQQLLAEGESCWERRPFDAFYMRPWLEEALERLALAPGARVLEIGCGTGPISCFLAARGYEVLGLDIAPTAIAMAKQHAADRGLTARFEVADVVEMDDNAKFDLVVDGHCLHCIVFDDERRQLLAAVARRLDVGAAFVVETMARHPDVRFDPVFRLDETGVLWSGKVPEAERPSRRILEPSALSAELRAAGFLFQY